MEGVVGAGVVSLGLRHLPKRFQIFLGVVVGVAVACIVCVSIAALLVVLSVV